MTGHEPIDHGELMVDPGERAGLDGRETDHTRPFASEAEAAGVADALAEELASLQDILLAHEDYGVLALFQGMDGAGKDGTIKTVMSIADPQGVTVTAFKKMTHRQVKQDYLRRASAALPERGKIGIFNRSYYEQVAMDQVHQENLDEQTLPSHLKGPDLWARRYREINDWERYLADNGIVVLKFFLHLSKAKQRDRLLERTELPEKMWKFSARDLEDRERWDEFMGVYEDLITETSTERAPWYVIPADHRWYSALAVRSIVVATLRSLHTDYPEMPKAKRDEMREAREQLEAERTAKR